MKLPRNPSKETSGVFAHDKLARLVESAKGGAKGISAELERVNLQNVHNERQGEGHRDEEVFGRDVARLEDMMASIKDAMNVSAAVQERGRRERSAQGRNVAEEDPNGQCAECCGNRGAVNAPRRWLLEDTRPARARRKQVTVQKKKVIVRSFSLLCDAHKTYPHCITTRVKKYTL